MSRVGLVCNRDLAPLTGIADLAADRASREFSPRAQETLERRLLTLSERKLLAVQD